MSLGRVMLKNTQLPEDVTKYRETKRFNLTTVPKGFLKNHSTKEGVWGRLVVCSGSVTYQDIETAERRRVEADGFQVIEPQAVHFIEPSAEAEFFVEFYRSSDLERKDTHQGNVVIPTHAVDEPLDGDKSS